MLQKIVLGYHDVNNATPIQANQCMCQCNEYIQENYQCSQCMCQCANHIQMANQAAAQIQAKNQCMCQCTYGMNQLNQCMCQCANYGMNQCNQCMCQCSFAAKPEDTEESVNE